MSKPSLHPRAEACGKVILLGEHAVVYGTPAIAVGLPQALVLTATQADDPASPIRLTIPRWDVDVTLTAESDHPVVRAALATFRVCDGPLRGWSIAGDASLPAGAGLGSSAALSVALARLVLGPHADPEPVVDASMAAERVFHGEPSGIDSEVATRGGLLRFVRGQSVQRIAAHGTLPLVVVNSEVGRSTGALVAAVRARHDRLPMVVRPILDAISQCVAQGQHCVESGDLMRLGELMTIDQGLLCSLGVSSPILDELCSTALSHGALGAKLTGAGGGGCIVAIPGPGSARTELLKAFTARGLSPFAVDVAAA